MEVAESNKRASQQQLQDLVFVRQLIVTREEQNLPAYRPCYWNTVMRHSITQRVSCCLSRSDLGTGAVSHDSDPKDSQEPQHKLQTSENQLAFVLSLRVRV